MQEASSDSVIRTLVQRLQQVRLSRNLSQQEVYDATGIHIGRLEAKPVNVTMRTLIILCRYYDVQLAPLFAGL
ncbi:helix-turn-helix domain-containing protein [Hymenobacter aerophilus]|uniref:helix-turn-helix domain-containing protein n=1 Tax=Hymenobacter aerophilus TaxID=119644 RepID=UPI0008FBE246